MDENVAEPGAVRYPAVGVVVRIGRFLTNTCGPGLTPTGSLTYSVGSCGGSWSGRWRPMSVRSVSLVLISRKLRAKLISRADKV